MVSFGLLDLTLPSPVENLPLDEALFEDLEENESHSIHREAECGTLDSRWEREGEIRNELECFRLD